MKSRIPFLLLLFVFVLQVSVCRPQGKDGALVVPPYPGSIAEPYPAGTDPYPMVPIESRLQTFYSKDAFEKVKAHYTKTVGPFEPTPDDITGFYAAAVPYPQVNDFLVKHGIDEGEAGGGFTRGERVGVTIYGKPINYDLTVVNVLDALKDAYLMRFIGLETEDPATVTKHLEDAEITHALAKYEHVQWEYFPLAKEKRMDEVIYDKHYTARAEALTKEQGELAKKMTELSTAGKYEEAGKVGDRIMQISALQSDAKYNWDIAIKCLQEMELNAYATKIVIDRPLAQWDLSSYPKK